MDSILKSERARIYALFAVTLLGAAFGNMSQTALSAMLPNVVAEYQENMAMGQWLTTIYMLVFGITVPLATYLTKKFSVKNIVYLASGFSLVGVLTAYFSWDFASLFVGRVLQAVSTGLLLPLIQTVAMTRFPLNQRATAMGVVGIALGTAPTVGPTIGGLMDFLFGWRSFFLLLLIVAVLLLAATVFLVEKDVPMDPSTTLDLMSFVLSSLGFGGLLLGFSNASTFALSDLLVWVPLALGVLFLVLFIYRQNHVEKPLISMKIFKSKQYIVGFGILVLLTTAFLGITLILSLFIVDVGGGTSLDAGLVQFPGVFAALFLSPLAGYLTDRIGIRPVVITGASVLLVGSAMLVFFDATTPFALVAFSQTLRAVGVSALFGPLTSYCLGGLSRELVTDGSSFTLAVRQAAASLGTSAMIFLVTRGAADGLYGAFGYHLAFGLSAALALAAFIGIVIGVKMESKST